jgi:iron complex outermembrane receptor protein
VKPEDTRHIEVGLKTDPFEGVRANITYFNTTIEDYQTQVVNSQVGVLRGYLANADKVRVQGFEFDTAAQIGDNASLYGSVAYTEGVYVAFPDAPAPLELTGGPQVVDASGTRLPASPNGRASSAANISCPECCSEQMANISPVSTSSYRSSFSSNPTASAYLNIDAYSLVNARIGFQGHNDGMCSSWARNLFDTEIFRASVGGARRLRSHCRPAR